MSGAQLVNICLNPNSIDFLAEACVKLISILMENQIHLCQMKLYFIFLVQTNNLYVCLLLRRQINQKKLIIILEARESMVQNVCALFKLKFGDDLCLRCSRSVSGQRGGQIC